MRHFFITLLCVLSTTAYAKDFVVVVNKHSPINKLDKREVANIFLSKTTRLRGNNRVTPLELSDSAYQELFYQEISGKTPSQINSYWTTLIFTGKGRPPKRIRKITQLIEVINNNPNAITYLPVDQVTITMKIVHVMN